MARIRTIKPDFFTSESVGVLSLHARLTFVGLWTYVDDRGRTKYNPRAIRGALWPNDEETVSSADVARFIDELADPEHEMVCRYCVDGKDYLHVVNFNKHQTINKPTVSKLPECPLHAKASGPTPPGAPLEESGTAPGGLPEGSGTTPGELPEDYRGEVEVERKGKEVNPSSTATPIDDAPAKRKPTKTDEHPRFAEFWTAYPRKVSIGDARKAFTKAVEDGTDPDQLIAAAVRFRAHCQRTGRPKDKTRHAATWINGESWRDDLDAEEAPTAPATGDGPSPELPPPKPKRTCPIHFEQLPESGICRGCAGDAKARGEEDLDQRPPVQAPPEAEPPPRTTKQLIAMERAVAAGLVIIPDLTERTRCIDEAVDQLLAAGAVIPVAQDIARLAAKLHAQAADHPPDQET